MLKLICRQKIEFLIRVSCHGLKKMPAGWNYLGSLVKEVCKEAGIEGEKSNHSLRVTGATRMWEANVPEKLIQQRTGHRSSEKL